MEGGALGGGGRGGAWQSVAIEEGEQGVTKLLASLLLYHSRSRLTSAEFGGKRITNSSEFRAKKSRQFRPLNLPK